MATTPTSSSHFLPSSPSSVSSKPTNSVVITAPPWAKDEPPSPKDDASMHELLTESRPSDVASYQSSNPASPSRWWTFTSPRATGQYLQPDPRPFRTERKTSTFRDRSISWLPTSTSGPSSLSKRFERVRSPSQEAKSPTLSLQLPAQPERPFTLAHTATPGWDSPWTSRPAAQGPNYQPDYESGNSISRAEETDTFSNRGTKSIGTSEKRSKNLRRFIVANHYVPLLFRVINIALTTGALGVAITVRRLERRNGVGGIIGSSPTLVVIFAPLTLVHVMAAIYLEYFGRPLGLWRTSAKLAHTLSEVLFICAWSAALSLCFDNYFTSLVPCTKQSQISWYSNLGRPRSDLPTFEGSIGDQICDEQLSLICLVGIGLLMYCTNLVISLYRIFEKVKYHPAAARP